MKRRTIKNKIMAILLVTAGLVPVFIEGDATVLVLSLIFAIPMFFAKKDLTYKGTSKKA